MESKICVFFNYIAIIFQISCKKNFKISCFMEIEENLPFSSYIFHVWFKEGVQTDNETIDFTPDYSKMVQAFYEKFGLNSSKITKFLFEKNTNQCKKQIFLDL